MLPESDEDFSERIFGDCLPSKTILTTDTLLQLSGKKELAENSFGSGLSTRVAKAWVTPLNQLRCTQIRVLVGQKFGLEWLASPVAIFVSLHPQAECTFYPGDLTLAALRAYEELFQLAPTEAKAMLSQDFSWMDAVYAFDPDGLIIAEAKSLLFEAKKRSGHFH